VPHIAISVIGVLLAAVISGATGLAFPLIAAPIFLIDYAPPQAVLITGMCSIIGQLLSLALLRRSIFYEVRWRLVLTGLMAVPFGTMFLLWSDVRLVRVGLGGLLILSGLWQLCRRGVADRFDYDRWEMLVGMCGGFCGGMFGVSSVVPAIWLSMCGLEKDRQRAIIQPYIIAVQAASLLVLACRAEVAAPVGAALAIHLAPLVAGICLGTFGFRFLSCELYSKIVATIVVVSGVVLLVH
jgi:hypothetical protein